MARPEVLEALDGTARLDPAALAQNLDDLARLKRWLHYDAELWQELWTTLGGEPWRTWTVLDVATGGADVPLALATRASEAGLALQVIAIDRLPQVAREAARRTSGLARVAIAQADALRLPLPADGVDVALCSFTLHHFPWEQARALLAELQRVARVGLIVGDLVRSGLGYWAAWLLAQGFVGEKHRFTRRDAPLSVRRAYSLRQVRQLAAEAGLAQPVVVRRFPFRVVLLAPGPAFTESERRG